MQYLCLVSNSTQNEIIEKKIENALKLATANLDAKSAGRSDLDTSLNYVIELVVLLLTFGYSFLPYLLTALGLAIKGLLKNLFEGLKQKGLIGGLLSGLKGLLDNLGIGGIEGVDVLLSNVTA